jgi:hypothetical protein
MNRIFIAQQKVLKSTEVSIVAWTTPSSCILLTSGMGIVCGHSWTTLALLSSFDVLLAGFFRSSNDDGTAVHDIADIAMAMPSSTLPWLTIVSFSYSLSERLRSSSTFQL